MAEQGREAGIRISAAERDEAVRLLATHLSTGRLELAEYEFRCVRAVAARTRADVESLFGDLPLPHPDMTAAVSPKRATRSAARQETKANGLVATPLSEALSTLCALTLLLGIPGSIVLTVFFGAWWTIVAAVLVTIVAGSLEEAAKRRP